ncbi:unnamed protein product [Durusdinium trenchii]|uniref:U-box domain-containing protein n=1 Tax=Durusdinium trenchii TaxID=1381693 RepID=A0ABP0R2J1_9DINO
MFFAPARLDDGTLVECGLLFFLTICIMCFLVFLSFMSFLAYSMYSRRLEDLASLRLQALTVPAKRKNTKQQSRGRLRHEVCRHSVSLSDRMVKAFGTLWSGPNKTSSLIADDAEQSMPSLPSPCSFQSILEDRERLAMLLEEAAGESNRKTEEVARVSKELNKTTGQLERLRVCLEASQGIEAENQCILSENHVLKTEIAATQKELKNLREIVDELRHDCLCPIHQTPMQSPVVAADGHSYDRKAIERWVSQHGTSPMTNMALPSTSFVPNILASKFVGCLERADPSWRSPIEYTESDEESSEHTPRVWISDSEDSPHETGTPRDVYNEDSAAEVLRALLTNNDETAPVEALWNVSNAGSDDGMQ